MIKTQNTTHQKPLEQSPFWRIGSPQKLAELLKTPLEDLEAASASWGNEYKQFRSKEKDRWIETPLPRLHKIQRRIHRLLVRMGPPEYLYSGFKGRSAYMSALRHDGSKPFVKLDIRKFYPSSEGRRVFDLFRQKFQCAPDVCAILFKLCTIKATKNSARPHLPTGGVTSPILAYFCYMDMFEELHVLATQCGLTLSVMADDICMSGDLADAKVLQKAEAIISNYGLRSHWKKRKSWPSKHPNKILTGIQITPGGLRVPRARKLKILQFSKELDNAATPAARAKAYQKLCGALSSVGQIEPHFKARSEKALADWRADTEAWSHHLQASASRPRQKRTR